MRIEINNNKCKLVCGMQDLREIIKNFSIRVPGAFFSPAFRNHSWDGKQKFVTDSGYFSTGLLPQVLDFIEKELNGTDIEFIDFREQNLRKKKITQVGSLTLRQNQLNVLKAVRKNYIRDLYFPRGIISASTNAGKTLMAAGIFKTFKDEPTIVLLNNKTLFDQFMKEIPELVGKDFGWVRSDDVKWGKFTLAMVPTLLSRLEQYGDKLAKFKVAIVDECHLSTSKSYKAVLTKLFNTSVRIGMSGSALSHKDKIKNQTVRSFFGEVIYTISSEELEEAGYSVPITVRIEEGNITANYPKDYTLEYEKGITKNDDRNRKVWKRVSKCLKKKRYPLLIVVQRHEHIKELMRLCPKELKADYLVKFIHHKVVNRTEILEEFKMGKVDILISSMIIKIGQNMPLMKATINAGGGDSVINTLQLLGRNKRTHESKKRAFYYDFWDQGSYLKRHSKHRRNVFIQEKHKVVDAFKKDYY